MKRLVIRISDGFHVPNGRGICLASALICIVLSALARVPSHAASPISPSGLETHVSDPIPINGQTHFNITGGSRPLASDGHPGPNLFHSFNDFNIPSNAIANFKNDSGLATSNILGRVTGGNPSSIFGALQTEGFGSANLFLINPSGIVLGPTATLHVGGSVNLSTANYVRLYDGTHSAIFYADSANDSVTTVGRNSILSSAPLVDFGFVTPAAFGFMNSTPAAITVYSNELSNSQGISLVGGNKGFAYTKPDSDTRTSVPDGVPIHNGKVIVPGGQINIASVASPGEILYGSLQTTSNIKGDSFTAMGAISLSEGTLLDVSGNAGGSIKIRGGQLIISDATLAANTHNTPGARVAININLTGDLTIFDTRAAPAITAVTNGTGAAGEIKITSSNLEATSTDPGFKPFILIDAHSSGAGRAGDTTIATTGNLNVLGPARTWHFIDTGPQADGPAGNIQLNAGGSLTLQGTTISTGTQFAEVKNLEPRGTAGSLSLRANTLVLSDVSLLTTAFFDIETQQPGNIAIQAHDALMKNSAISTAGWWGGGAITIDADKLITESTRLDTFTVSGPAKGITFNGQILELHKGSTWSTSTNGDKDAGPITVDTSDHVNIIGNGGTDPSGLFSNSLGELISGGRSGNITITTPKLTLKEGRINTSTATSGHGGNVIINTSTLEISGEFPFPDDGGFFGITNIHPSGIFTQTVGNEFCSGPCGNAGNIGIVTDSIRMTSGSQINSGTTNNGQGGNINVSVRNTISMSGVLSNGDAVGILSRSISPELNAGPGGNISVTAAQSVTIQDGASVSAGSTGLGDAGNISINAGQQLDVQDGSITTEALKASGGNIDIRAVDRVRFVNSQLSASVGADRGNGGNITIDPKVVILQNSDIRAQAVEGGGGDITIRTPVFLADQTSLVDASSQFGLSGTVTIQSPTSNLSGTVKQLTTKPSETQALLQNRCVALAGGEQSTFIVAGRDALPSEPGVWLSSPLSLEHLMGNGTEHAAGPTARNIGLSASPGMIPHANKTEGLSLRRLTPPGFLVRAFATGSTGCPS